jgi:hypothetical protein|tara:strand:- start:315 stop:590 length:276 start_codon:yes stop_codon:yes gene_type:complete
MNFKEAGRLKPGAIVRQSWDTRSVAPSLGLVIGKVHVTERHSAKILGGTKEQRYDVVVHWFNGRGRRVTPGTGPRVETLQNWEIMMVSHAK